MAAEVLKFLASLFVLTVTAWAGRKGSTLLKGILLGVLSGALISFCLGAALGFLNEVLPFGQIDFWLASKWSQLFGS